MQTLEVGVEPGGPALADLLRAIPNVTRVEPDPKNKDIWQVHASQEVRPAILSAIAERGWLLSHLRQQDYGLEEIYMQYFQGG